jgi:hypothetical protein
LAIGPEQLPRDGADMSGDLDLPVDAALGVWYDLEQALAGKNGYGGDVAEIYAYRLVPKRIKDKTDPAFITGATDAEEQEAKVEAARVAGANMTGILRRFAELYEGVIFSIEEREGFRPINLAAEEFPPFDWRVQLRVTQTGPRAAAPAIHKLRAAIAKTAEYAGVLTGMLDELASSRAKERLGADVRDPANTNELPPDGATGTYLDRPFDVDDLGWLRTACGSVADATRPSQLMLVFNAIRGDALSTAEFLRVMNTIVLPLCRRLRLKAQPHLAQLGAASE